MSLFVELFCVFHFSTKMASASVKYCRCEFPLMMSLQISLCIREKIVDTLQESCADWREAAAGQNCEKLHAIVNMWLGLEITPAEFRRINRLGHTSMPSSIERIGDTALNMKLDKVCFRPFLLYWPLFFGILCLNIKFYFCRCGCSGAGW